MNFKFVVIINLFLLLGVNFSAYAKNIPPKLKPEKFIDSSAYSSKSSKFFDNLSKNKKKEQPILKPKDEVIIQEEKTQKKEEPKKEVKEKKIPEKKQEVIKPQETTKTKETKEVKKRDIEKTEVTKEIVPKIKPSDFKNFTPEQKGPLETKTLSDKDFEITKVVFDYVDRKQWRLALSDAQKIQDKTIYTLVNWMYLIEPQSGASFNEYQTFIKNHKDWPRINRIKIFSRT